MGVVDIEIVPRAHAILSASSAERWLVCTPSARIEEAMADEGSSYAQDGTAAHAFAEVTLRHRLGQISTVEYDAGYTATESLYQEIVDAWLPSDWEAIEEYVEYVLSEAERLDAVVQIEARVDYSKYAEGGFGTSDALLVSETQGIIKSIDLKFGKGVPVSAADNPQAKLYALGGILGLSAEVRRKITKVEWTIHQPRLGYVGTDDMTAVELRDWAELTVRPAAELAWKGEGKLTPSAKGCRFCKVASTCRARAAENVLIAKRDFMPHMGEDNKFEEQLLTMDEIGHILPELDQYIAWANSVKEYALTQARDKGASIPGYKVVRGRTTRQWRPGADIPALLGTQPDVDPTALYEPQKLKSVAQMEKALGKAKFAGLADSLPLIVQSTGTPALVPETDSRPAIDEVAEARAAFGVDTTP